MSKGDSSECYVNMIHFDKSGEIPENDSGFDVNRLSRIQHCIRQTHRFKKVYP
jgi:hypothetical protein